jgi:drug/metabolite transporter (DMT)-like permease
MAPRRATTGTVLLSLAALLCFAGNSILCRRGLGAQLIDAASYTTTRLVSGALVLAILVAARGHKSEVRRPGGWAGAASLFAYAALFSYAYLRIPAGTGALILFGMVQITMLSWSIYSGSRPSPFEWTGLVTAGAGLVALTFPGLRAPDAVGAASMGAAGIAWGVYSLLGRGATDPLATTAKNFLRALPLTLVLSVATSSWAHVSGLGLVLAAASGGIASGIGYSLWYAALAGLTATRAAIVQLAVPALTAAAGALLLGEALELRTTLAGVVILAGIGVSMMGRK